LTSPFPVKLSFSSSGSRYFNDDVDAAVRLNAKSNGSAESISADAVEACAREHTCLYKHDEPRQGFIAREKRAG
jgi:hypothetical protein